MLLLTPNLLEKLSFVFISASFNLTLGIGKIFIESQMLVPGTVHGKSRNGCEVCAIQTSPWLLYCFGLVQKFLAVLLF